MNIQNLSSISNLYKYYNVGMEHFTADPEENKDCIINDNYPRPGGNCNEGYICWGFKDDNNLGKCKLTETYWADKAFQTFKNNAQASYDMVMASPPHERKSKFEAMVKQAEKERPIATEHSNSISSNTGLIDIKDIPNQDMYDMLEKNYHGKLSNLKGVEREKINQNKLLSAKNKLHSRQFNKLKSIEDKVQTVNRNIMYDMKDAKYSNVILGYARRLFIILSMISLVLLFIKLKN